MFKWQNMLAVSLIVMGAVGFKLNDLIGEHFRSVTTSNKPLAASVYDKVLHSTAASETAAVYVEWVSVGMLVSGVVWLTKRASKRRIDNRFVLDFSKKNKQNQSN